MTFMHQRFWPQSDVELVHTDTFGILREDKELTAQWPLWSHPMGNNKNYCFSRILFSERVSCVTDGTVERERESRFIARAIDEFRCGIKRILPAKDELLRRPRPFLSTIRWVAYLTVCMHNRRSQTIVAYINRNTLELTDSVVWYKRARLRQLMSLG